MKKKSPGMDDFLIIKTPSNFGQALTTQWIRLCLPCQPKDLLLLF